MAPSEMLKDLIRYHQVDIELHLVSQTETVRAGSKRIIERKTSRLDLVNTDLAVRAGKTLAEIYDISIHRVHHQKSVCKIKDSLDGI